MKSLSSCSAPKYHSELISRGSDAIFAEIVSKRESESRPGAGIVRTQARLTNQDGAVVMECETVTLVEKRPGPD